MYMLWLIIYMTVCIYGSSRPYKHIKKGIKEYLLQSDRKWNMFIDDKIIAYKYIWKPDANNDELEN